jgi:hypothetical protein
LVSHHGVENGEELAGDGYEDGLGGFASASSLSRSATRAGMRREALSATM